MPIDTLHLEPNDPVPGGSKRLENLGIHILLFVVSTATLMATPPQATGVTPVNGTASAATFTATFNTQGGSAIQWTSMLISSVLNGPYSCWVQVDIFQSKFYLVNNAGTTTFAPIAPGSSSTVANGQCKLIGAGSGISVSGQTVTVAVQLEFLASFPTPPSTTKYIWISADNQNNEGSGWVGGNSPGYDWRWNTGFGHQAPYIDSAIPLEPESGQAPAQMFTAVFSDYEGAQDLGGVDMLVNSVLNGPGACWIRWVRSSDRLYLINDAGSDVIQPGFAPASSVEPIDGRSLTQVPETVANSQCRLLQEGSLVRRVSTNALSVRLHIQFHPGFAGAKAVWISASDNNGLFSGWVQKGAFTVTTAPNPAGISPVSLETNIGPFPVDVYTAINCRPGLNCLTTPADRYVPSCLSTISVRDCYRELLKTRADSYYIQGIRGVRFQFGLGGGANSTPLTSTGLVQQIWVDRMRMFFDDLKSWGFTHVSPTPVMLESWSDPSGAPSVVVHSNNLTRPAGCQTPNPNVNFYFHKWLPFGFTNIAIPPQNPDYRAEGENNNTSYTCGYHNPQFWGWNPLFGVLDAVANAAYQIEPTLGNRLMIRDFDLQNETPLSFLPIMGRLVWDNTTGLDVTIGVGNALRGFGSRPLYTYASSSISTTIQRPDVRSPAFDCVSLYGDSAQLTNLVNMYAAQAGGAFGVPPVTEARFGMACSDPKLQTVRTACDSPFATDSDFNPQWSACMSSGMITVPRQEVITPPHVLNTHAHVCVNAVGNDCQLRTYTATGDFGQPFPNTPPPDATSTAMSFYGSVWSLMRGRQLTNRVIAFGETSTNSGTTANPCEETMPGSYGGSSDVQAQQNAKGLKQSTLRSNDAAAVTRVLRPWANAASQQPCSFLPSRLGGIGDPFKQ